MYSAYMQRDPLGDIVVGFVGLFILVVAACLAAAVIYVVVLPFTLATALFEFLRRKWCKWRKWQAEAGLLKGV